MTKAEPLNNARNLFQEAVDVASRAGIDPPHVVAAHCSETSTAQDNGDV